LVRAGFSVAAAHAACFASNPDCYLKLLIAFAADDSCVMIMTEQHRFMQCLSGTQYFMQRFFGPMFAMLIKKLTFGSDLAQRSYSPMFEKILSRLTDVTFGVDYPRVPQHWCHCPPPPSSSLMSYRVQIISASIA
jgi:hypothetical protein